MRIRFSHILAIAALATIATSAFAQPGAGPGRAEGRERANMGRMQMGAQGGLMLLVNPQVQDELKLSAEQRQQIADIAARAREELRPQPGQRPDAGGIRGGMERYTEEAMRVLRPAQRERFEQIQLRVQGPRAMGRDDVADKVGLSQDQRKQIRNIVREGMGGREDARPNPGEWNPEEMRARMEERRQQIDQKILALLTAEQRSKWESMLGAPFELRRQRR